jgi:cytochrome c-type biogenesis protein
VSGWTAWKAAACVLPLAAATACGAAEDGEYRPLQPGDAAPAYAAATLAGDSVDLVDLRGSVVMLNIWATWCLPCRDEMPGLQSLHERFGAEGLRVIGVSIDARSADESVAIFVQDFGVTFTILHDPTDRVTRAFRAVGVPSTFLIGRDGDILRRWIGRFEPEAPEIVELVQQALRSS